MSWTTPRTWVAGEVVTAAIMNTHVRDNLSALRSPVTFGARRSTNQAMNNGADTKVQFATEDFDVGGYYDAATNFRFLPLVGGYYRLTAVIDFTQDAWNNVAASVKLYKNGSSFATLWALTSGMTDEPIATGEIIVLANGTTDYFEVYVNNPDGSSHNVQGRFEGHLVSAT